MGFENINGDSRRNTFNLEEAVLGVAATLAFEGYESNEEDLAVSRKLLNGEIDSEEYIKGIIEKFKGD